MIENVGQNRSYVFWQEPKSEDCPIGEPAVVLRRYSDCLSLQQESRYINITLECVPEFIKAIKEVMKER